MQPPTVYRAWKRRFERVLTAGGDTRSHRQGGREVSPPFRIAYPHYR